MKILNSKGSLVTTGSRAGKQLSHLGDHPYATAAVVGVAALAISALVNGRLAKDAERRNPPKGQFLEIDGVRLHYVERGKGEPLVLLHGNGSMIQDFEFERAPRQGRQEVSRHRLRPAGIWPQPAPARHALDPGSAGRPDPRSPPGARRDAGHRPRTLLGRLGRRGPGAEARRQREGAGPRLGVLLPDGPRRRRGGVRAGDPDPRRHPALHAGAPPGPDHVAGPDAEDLRTGGSPAEVHQGLSGRTCASSLSAPRQRGGSLP